MEKEKEKEKKKKKQGENEVLQFYIYKLPIDRPAAVTGNHLVKLGLGNNRKKCTSERINQR